jgi:hypothetical protein
MTDSAIRSEACIDREREQWIRQYEKMICVVCGEPLRSYLAHYPHEMHVRCLLDKSREVGRRPASGSRKPDVEPLVSTLSVS